MNKVSTQIIELDLTGIKDMSPYIYTYSSEEGTYHYIQYKILSIQETTKAEEANYVYTYIHTCVVYQRNPQRHKHYTGIYRNLHKY